MIFDSSDFWNSLQEFITHEEMTIGMASGIISGGITSILIFLFRRNIKPRIIISKKIVKRADNRHQIKFYNDKRSRLLNVNAKLELFNRYPVGESYNVVTENIPLKTSRFEMIPGKKDRDYITDDHCVCLSTNIDLINKLNKTDWAQLRITIVAENQKSGTKESFVHYYNGEEFILENSIFESGETFEVLSEKESLLDLYNIKIGDKE